MSWIDYILPMLLTRQICFVVFPGFELLDLSGPAAVFAHANAVYGKPVYRVLCAASNPGEVISSVDIAVFAEAMESLKLEQEDTVLVVGGEWGAVNLATEDGQLLKWLRGTPKRVRRYGSVCLGAFVLASAGLLDHRRATTHWQVCGTLSQQVQQAHIHAEAIYVQDGSLWTSAGVTTGIDMALEMVAQDLGSQIKSQIAERLVIQAHRGANSTQRSSVLQAQSEAGDRIADLLTWVEMNLAVQFNNADLAERVGLSERSFYRAFTQRLQQSPGAYVRERRMQKALALLRSGVAIKRVVHEVGFLSEAAFRKAFVARFGAKPSDKHLLG